MLWKQQIEKGKVGGVAQLGEHLPCTQRVRSSILLISTICAHQTLKTDLSDQWKLIAEICS